MVLVNGSPIKQYILFEPNEKLSVEYDHPAAATIWPLIKLPLDLQLRLLLSSAAATILPAAVNNWPLCRCDY